MRGSLGVLASAALAVMALAACSLLPAPTATPGPVVVVPPGRPPGPADTALQGLDPEEVLRSVAGGDACRPGTLIGSHSAYHMLRDYVCPRIGDDRNVYFLFAEAWEASLKETGARMGGGGGAMGALDDPVTQDWTLAGETMAGTSRVLGVNGPGKLTLYVSLDLVTP
jgi:hypothetical protein